MRSELHRQLQEWRADRRDRYVRGLRAVKPDINVRAYEVMCEPLRKWGKDLPALIEHREALRADVRALLVREYRRRAQHCRDQLIEVTTRLETETRALDALADAFDDPDGTVADLSVRWSREYFQFRLKRHILSRPPGDAFMLRVYAILAAVTISFGDCANVTAQESLPAALAGKTLMRTDGQRITGNPKLEAQDKEDRAACVAIAKDQKNWVELWIGCMASRGYMLVPTDKVEALAAAARAAVKKQAKPTPHLSTEKVVPPAKPSEADRAELTKVMKDAVAARHGGVLPKTMSEEDTEVAAQAGIEWKAKKTAADNKRSLTAMKVKPPPSSGDAEIYLAKDAITKMMRDPDSTVFSDVFFVNDRKSATGYYVPVVCGSVNGRNGFGGMTGPKHFVVIMSDLVQGLWLEGTTANDVMATEWNRFCAGNHR